MNISAEYSVSLHFMKPYFLIASFFLPLSMVWLFFIDPFAPLTSLETVGWVHLYFLGFVMLSIFSAMAQLGPVIVETKHKNEKIFKTIWKFLIPGIVFMVAGFYLNISLLLVGGGLVFVAMALYAFEFLWTLQTMKRKTTITYAMKLSNIFLLLGIINGLIMALGFNGYLAVKIQTYLELHTFMLLLGFILVLIMGASIILIPMFGLAKRLSDNTFAKSFIPLVLALAFILLGVFDPYLTQMAYVMAFISIGFYIYQLYSMFASRKKVVYDIWTLHIYVAYSSFLVSIFFFLLSIHNQVFLAPSFWLFFVGFIGFLIIGNFYKIVPFLLWFYKYAPLIEEQSVPMLHQLINQKRVHLQWFFSSFGVVLSSFALLFDNGNLFYGGVTLLSVGGVLFFLEIYKVLKAL